MLVIALGEPLVIRELRERKRAGLLSGKLIELCVEIAVGGKDVFGIEPLAFGVALSLLHPFQNIFAFFFGFENCYRQGLWPIRNFDAQQVIHFARSAAAASFRTNRLHRGRGFQPNVRQTIAFAPKDRIDHLKPRFGFVLRHGGGSSKQSSWEPSPLTR